MGYRKVYYHQSMIGSIEKLEGETIEQKMERVLENNEPITDGAPEIFTDRKDGVGAAYNIRTDRWEIACEGMDAVSRSIAAKREHKAKMNVVEDGAESKEVTGTDGESGA